MIRDEDIELVKSQVNMRMLAEHFGIRVNQNGMALCPFHSDKHPSMKIHNGYLSNDGYYCWSCGSGGTVFSFVMNYCNMDFEESVKYIAGSFGIEVAGETELTPDEKSQIAHQMKMREFEIEFREMQLRALSALAEKIEFYRRIQRNAEPFGGLFCWLSNQLPNLKGQWDNLYEEIYGNGGGALHR